MKIRSTTAQCKKPRCVPKIASPEAQKKLKIRSNTAQYKKHRCVPKIASPDARTQPLILPDEGLIL